MAKLWLSSYVMCKYGSSKFSYLQSNLFLRLPLPLPLPLTLTLTIQLFAFWLDGQIRAIWLKLRAYKNEKLFYNKYRMIFEWPNRKRPMRTRRGSSKIDWLNWLMHSVNKQAYTFHSTWFHSGFYFFRFCIEPKTAKLYQKRTKIIFYLYIYLSNPKRPITS